MARIVVIGGSGHVGTHLLPALIQLGHEVVNVSRGTASPYRQHAAWKAIEQVAIDRKAEEAKGSFGVRIADLNPDIVVDMILFKLEERSSWSRHYVARLSTTSFAALFGCTVMRRRFLQWKPTPRTALTSTESTRRRSSAGFHSKRAGTAFLQRASGQVTSSARVGCPSILRRTQTPMFSRRLQEAENSPCRTLAWRWCIMSTRMM